MADKYRLNVGIMIINNRNEILVGKRIDHPSGYWQMPQGGIDKNEIPEEAVWREMIEEIGTNNAKIIKVSDYWIKYEIPKETLRRLPWGGTYVGQKQKWFLFRFMGQEKDINIQTVSPEFSEWKWINYNLLLDNIVPFKRKVYKEILKEFSSFFN